MALSSERPANQLPQAGIEENGSDAPQADRVRARLASGISQNLSLLAVLCNMSNF